MIPNLFLVTTTRSWFSLLSVIGYKRTGRPPEEVAIMEKAALYKADAVFFEKNKNI